MENIHEKIAAIHSTQKTMPTPFYYFDTLQLKKNYEEFASNLPNNGKIYFSVKANNDERILQTLKDLGSNFDVASYGEIELLHRLGVDANRMSFSATIKVPTHIKKAYELGVRLYAADSLCELEKIAELAPKSSVFLRIAVSNEGSLWPLVNKFGCSIDECLDLLEKAHDLGLLPVGVAFHVGSQCIRVDTWIDALEQVQDIWKKASARGVNLQLINFGGGFPACYESEVPSFEAITRKIKTYLHDNFPDTIDLIFEPGRAMVANTAVLVTSVISKANRQGQDWIYVDTSVYNGLIEALDNWKYTIVSDKSDIANEKLCIIAGPTCDSTDVIAKNVLLPELSVGDKLYIFGAGAYTNAMKMYNGYTFPQLFFHDEVK